MEKLAEQIFSVAMDCSLFLYEAQDRNVAFADN